MSGVVESLPSRPLTEEEVAALNHADPIELVVPVEREEAVSTDDMEEVTVSEGIIVVTSSWAKALVFDDGWRVVKSVSLADVADRTEAMLACENAIEDARLPGERAT